MSCSDEAAESGHIALKDYQVVDYILGLEKEDNYNPASNRRYKTFTPAMQSLLTDYCRQRGNLLVSGAYVGSDMNTQPQDRAFTHDILKFECTASLRTEGQMLNIGGMNRNFSLCGMPNEQVYAVPSTDCLQATGSAFPAMLYTDRNYPAAVAYPGSDYRTFVMGFPFESIRTEAGRNALMASILRFFGEQSATR